jgi:DNA-binding transcriptional LysR family regulator
VRHLLGEGKLVRLTDLEMPAPGSYYLTWNDRRILSPAAETLRAWLREISLQERQAS